MLKSSQCTRGHLRLGKRRTALAKWIGYYHNFSLVNLPDIVSSGTRGEGISWGKLPSCRAILPGLEAPKKEARFIVDLRKVNPRLSLVLHAYPLPRQEGNGLGGAEVFSIMDIVKGFFQQPIFRRGSLEDDLRHPTPRIGNFHGVPQH